jgi:hypothetical protein
MTPTPFRSDTIAAVMFALYESVDVSRCLSSLQWCDEIVLVDSGSEDRHRASQLESGVGGHEHSPPSIENIFESLARSLSHSRSVHP